MAGSPPVSENEDWLSILSCTTVIAYPLAIHAALKLGVFEILHSHGALSAQQIAHLLPRPVSNPRAPLLLDRLLYLLSLPSTVLPRPPLAASASASASPASLTLVYSLLPAGKFFVKDERGVCLGEYMNARTMALLNAYKHLDSVIVEGGDGFHKESGHKISDHVAHHAEELEAVMASLTSAFMKQFLGVYDGFKNVSVLVDVGGATGYTLVHILDKYPHLQGINLDQPHMAAKGLTHPRLKHVGGSMLESIPPTEAALMKLILHDWEDNECIKILRNCKDAITSKHGKVVVIDFHVPELTDGFVPKHHFDILFMASHGGKLRTIADFRSLGQAAGFSDVKLACIVNEYCILEFLP